MKRITTILTFLMLVCMGTWAKSYTITYGTTTGTFYRSGSASTDWSSKWVSNETGKPVVTITTSVNYMNGANARIMPQTYTIYTEAGYKVTGFAMNCPTFGATVTVTPAGESAVAVEQNGTLVVNSSASSFVFAGGSNSARIQAGSNDGGSFTITVEDDAWAPSFDEGTVLTVGDKVSSFTAATAADDNDHWYVLTQVRDGESPMYDNGIGETLKRAATSVKKASLGGEMASANEKYLIRFKSVGEGTYKIQFANGYWIDGNLKTANFNTAGTYAFYNCNSGSGSYFAWNKDSKSGSIVDNNGAGNTVSFHSSGEVSGTSGNNVWYLYETELKTVADIDTEKSYVIYTVNNGTSDGSTNYYLTATGRLTNDVNAAGQFSFTATTSDQFVSKGHAYKISAGTYRFTNPASGSRDNYIHYTTNDRDAWEAQVFFYNGSKYAIRATNTINSSHDTNAFWTVKTDGDSDGIPEADYDANLDVKHYVWQLMDASTLSLVEDITYTVKDADGNTLDSATGDSYQGYAPSVPSSATRPFCSYTYYSDEDMTTPLAAITAETSQVYAKYSVAPNSPITFSTVESPVWHMIHFGGANKTWFCESGNTNIIIKEKSDYDTSDGFSWAFIGTPYGVKIYNKEVEAYVNVGTPSEGEKSGVMNESDGTVWVINGNPITKSLTDFGLQALNTSYYVNAWNGGNTFGLYTTGTSGDTGSTLRVTNIETLDHKSFVDAFIQPYIDSKSGSYFDITADQATTLSSTYGKASYSASDYSSYLTALNAAIKTPTAGYYLLKNVKSGTYLKLTDVLNVGGANTDAAAVIKVVPVSTGYTLQIQGTYIQVPGYNTQVTTSASPATLYAYPVVTNGAVVPGQVTVGSNIGAHSYLNYADGIVKGYEPTGNSGWWTLESVSTVSVPLTAIGGNTYATTYLPFDATVSESDVTANAVVVADVHVGYVVPTALKDNKIPAGTPVILRGANTSATSATLTIRTTGDAFSALSGTSALEGVYVNTDFSLSETDDESNSCTADYFLGMLDGALGFYHSGIETPASSGNYTLSANRAYLPAGKVAASRGFAIKWSDDDVTGIRAIDNGKQAQNNGVYYDLSGRRVENPQHGMYIVNGRVVVIK